MTDKLDLSLDDIIKITKKPGRGGNRGRGNRRGRGGVGQARNIQGRPGQKIKSSLIC